MSRLGHAEAILGMNFFLGLHVKALYSVCVRCVAWARQTDEPRRARAVGRSVPKSRGMGCEPIV